MAEKTIYLEDEHIKLKSYIRMIESKNIVLTKTLELSQIYLNEARQLIVELCEKLEELEIQLKHGEK